MTDTYYITTSIPYVNAAPHLGHALEFAQADTIARYCRQQGGDVRLLTGTDDNSLKNVLAAEREGVPVQELVNRNAQAFIELAQEIQLSNDDFVRTSVDPRHEQGVRRLWERLDQQGDLYKRAYSGLYCVGCEQFTTEEELIDGVCPDHGTRPEIVEEENYFFRLSRYEGQLREAIESGALQIVPESRRNEVSALIAQGLNDFSVSRTRQRARGWGILVPGDPTQVMYVWFDALANYITGLGYGSDAALYQRYWLNNPYRVHVIGKDILRFHSVYWPAMLLAAGEPLPSTLLVHGFLTVGGQKISKSRGNRIDPRELIQGYGADAVRYWLLRAVPPTDDADYTEEKFIQRYNAELANDIGNLVQRATALVTRYADGVVPAPACVGRAEERLLAQAQPLPEVVADAFQRLALDDALAAILTLVSAANRYAEETAPWKIARDVASGVTGTREQLETTLYHLAEAARLTCWYLWPFIPTSAAEGHRRLCGQDPEGGLGTFGSVSPGRVVRAGAPLFPRFDAARA
ncbi:MAG TPA: methionine--tRNA ligase [Chloroflexota bacterium]|nr:methionine--tRNA ligase [Chloroflexota bacterium]